MPVEHFTREQFEAALPKTKDGKYPLWLSVGTDAGEYVYVLPIPNPHLPTLAISIRSSVHTDGHSAATGEDSIRCWLMDSRTREPYGSKLQKFITRVRGWDKRMTTTLRTLYKIGLSLKPCPGCRLLMKPFVSKKPQSKGRIFQSCPNTRPEIGKCGKGFEWITFREGPKCEDPGCDEAGYLPKAGKLDLMYGIDATGRREKLREEGKD